MVLALLVMVMLTAGAPALADQSAGNGLPHNIYGTHPMITDIMSPWHIETHLIWTRTLTGPGGWVKILMYPIRPDTVGAQESWRQFVQTCYNKELIPVIRIGLWMQQGGAWVKPPKDSDGSYRSIAQAIKRVVMSLPKDDNIPLYIELLNEPNNAVEWSGEYPEPIEYARFFVETSNAIRSLADPRIKIATGALSPGGSYDNLLYIEEMCTHVPEFINAWDVWCTHPYTNIPPEINHHDGTAGMNRYTIDHYVMELEVLAHYGRTNVQVFGAEGGYLGNSADKMMRAFRDYYSKWPEVLGMSPWFLSNPFNIEEGVDWVRNDSVGAYPSGSAHIYDMVYNLAKPWITAGTVSGKGTESEFNSPLSSVQVTLQPGGQTYMTDTAGNYIFPSLQPGTHSVEVTKPNYTSGSKAEIAVTATNNEVADFQLEATAGIVLKGTFRLQSGNLSTMKQQAAGRAVTTDNVKAVTAVIDSHTFYMQEPDRSSGIRVRTSVPHGQTAGRRVILHGYLNVVNGEAVIENAKITSSGAGTAAKPMDVMLADLGGESNGVQQGTQGSVGLSNTGLLVRAWGKASQLDSTSFILDDGSFDAVLCRLISGTVGFDGKNVELQGISSCELTDGQLKPVLLVKSILKQIP